MIFDENKNWKWNNPGKESNTGPGMISLTFDGGEDNIRETKEEEIKNNTDDEPVIEDEDTPHEVEDDLSSQSLALRRSKRQSKKPRYLEDYVLLADLEANHVLMLVNEEPWDYNKAKDWRVWRKACEDEIFSIIKNITWSLVDFPAGCKPVGLKWVFKIKNKSDSSINK